MIAWPWRASTAIVDLTPRDAGRLAEIHAAAFARTGSAHDVAALLAETNVIGIGLSRASLLRGKALVGFVLVRVAADEAEILTIAVVPSARGRGYGRLLMEEALRRLYRERVATCFLEVDRANTAAVALYRKLGYVVRGERRGYYGAAQSGDGTALVMRAEVR
jgi:ribosomal-protein-alanine N-acetyltransferase